MRPPILQVSGGAASGQESWRRLLHVLAVNGRTLGGSILHHGAARLPPRFDQYLMKGSISFELSFFEFQSEYEIGRAPCSWDSHLAQRGAATSSPLQLLPDHLLSLIIRQVKSSAHVGALSRTCSTLHFQLRSPAMVADWLWRWKGRHGLFWAASKAPPVLKQLIEVHHAKVNVRNSHGASLLETAADQRFDAVFSALSHLLAAPDIDVSGALRHVHSERHALLVRELLLHPDINVNRVNVERGTPLQSACSRGAAAVVHELLQHPAIDVDAVDAKGRTALELAARGGHLECVKLLLRRQPYLDVYSALSTARGSQQGAVAALLSRHVRMRRGGIVGYAARSWGI